MGLWLLAPSAQGAFVGIGMASQTAGRQIPALEVGVDLGSVVIAGMTGGVSSAAYYHSFYQISLVVGFKKWGVSYLGELWAGFGLGAHYGEKNLLARDAAGDLQATATSPPDTDAMAGPAFRVEVRPLGNLYLSVDFVFGLGPAALVGGAGDSGLFALGVRL